ncbi:MAG: FAD-dependent oxidoreductase [Cytophagales bacterium]|nr:FAD-dependent oxidoreductase [Cytophagales bacterium]
MGNHVGIIGGGIIGLSTAYYLQKSGFQVTVLDKGNLTDNCSFGNAGMIVPSHFTPLASPGMVAKGMAWMMKSTSPFYVRPRWSADLLSWGLRFYRHANKAHVTRVGPDLLALSLFSKALYRQWAVEMPFEFGYLERGLLMLYQRADVEKEESEAAHTANQLGLEARVLTLPEIQQMEPDVRINARGGVYYPGDAHVIPQDLVTRLAVYLKKKGVRFETNTEVVGFATEHNSVRAAKTSRGEFAADAWVVASGSWSGILNKKLGCNLPLQAGKGYSFTLKDVKANTRIPTIFLESRVAVTPMGNQLRFGGTMEITGIDHTINMKRVKGIVDSIGAYYPDMTVGLPGPPDVWHGLRPCSPDGLPYVGRTKRWANVVMATGHSMMGLSLAPATGKVVSELLAGEVPGVDLSVFDPDRFDRG